LAQDDPSGGPRRIGVATYVVEAVVAAILLVIGVVVIVESRRLGSEWTSDGPGSGYFPFYIGLIIVISSLGLLYQSLLGKKRKTEVFVDSVQLRRVLSVLVPAAVYVLAIRFIGVYLTSAVYIALFMIVLGKYSPVRSVVAAIAINVFFFFLFEVWFKVPLFKGAFDPLGFLGY